LPLLLSLLPFCPISELYRDANEANIVSSCKLQDIAIAETQPSSTRPNTFIILHWFTHNQPALLSEFQRMWKQSSAPQLYTD
jgi:hypothetical protein